MTSQARCAAEGGKVEIEPDTGADQKSVVVPYTELAADLLHAVIESYVLREGTDYGEKEYSLDDKVAHVINQLKRGEAQIVFDPETESVSIVRSSRRKA
jgi:uncharacterized protein YheU (UPF0270 family)